MENEKAIMPLSDYKDACDKIREKTNTEDLIESGELTEKIDEVFEAGKNAEWNEIKGNASGEIIYIDDVSPIEHEMGIKVSGVDDLTTVKVRKLGKNLFKLENISVANGTIIEELENGVIVSGNASSGDSDWNNGWFTPNKNGRYIYLKKGNMVYVSADITWLNIDNYAGNKTFGIFLYDAKTNSGDLAYHTEYPTNSTINKTFRIILQIEITKDGSYFPIFTLNSCTMKIENIQISFDENEIYEPYIEPTEYISDADGVVSGVTSLYPSTTLMTDTDGVVINVTYNKAINNVEEVPERIDAVYEEGKRATYDNFWDIYQANGERRDYSYAFRYSYWNDSTFSPKYDIILGSGLYDSTMAFYNSGMSDIVSCLEKNGIKLITSNAPAMDGTFQTINSSTIPIIDMASCKKADLTFYNTNLKKLSIINLREDCVFDRTFNWNMALEELEIVGTIGKNGVDLSQSKKLTKNSIINVVNCLSLSTSELLIALSLKAIRKAFETSPDANDGDTSAEWLELQNSRSNWTISLL